MRGRIRTHTYRTDGNKSLFLSHGERDESVVSDKEGEEFSLVYKNTEVVNKTFAIEEVVRGDEEVPGERSKPWQVMHSGKVR